MAKAWLRPPFRCGLLLSAVWCVIAVLFPVSTAGAERLPIVRLTTADGLSHNYVGRIRRDSLGYVWFCTREGLSRYDGHAFVNYGLAEGLPGAVVNDLLEMPDGRYLIATNRGLVWFDPSRTATEPDTPAAAAFTTVVIGQAPDAPVVNSLHLDGGGRLWIGTNSGAFRSDVSFTPRATAHPVTAPVFTQVLPGLEVTTFAERNHVLWVGTSGGVFQRALRQADDSNLILPGPVTALLADEDALWVGSTTGLCRLGATSGPSEAAACVDYSRGASLPSTWIHDLVAGRNGRRYVVTNGGVVEIVGEERPQLRPIEFGRSTAATFALAEDGRSLWIGTSGGVVRTMATGFDIFDADAGVPTAGAIFTTPRDGVVVMGADAEWRMRVLRQRRFESLALTPTRHATWGWNQVTLVDRQGDVWTSTREGLLRFAAVQSLADLRRRSPRQVYGRHNVLPNDVILRLFEDSHGDLWVSSVGEGRRPNALSRWRRATESWSTSQDWPASRLSSATTCRRSPRPRPAACGSGSAVMAGWSACGEGRSSGSLRRMAFHRGAIRNLLVDAAGRVWAASYRGGLVRIDDADSTRPRFTVWNTSSGLSSNETTAVVDDARGRIYVGTARGINRLEPASGHITTFTSIEPLGEFQGAIRDAAGSLWFSSTLGVLRFTPPEGPRAPPVATRITGLRVAGSPAAIAATGELAPAEKAFAAGTSLLEVDYVAPSGADATERYQFMLPTGREPPGVRRPVSDRCPSPISRLVAIASWFVQ